ncbi:hypothetical protein V6N11_031224 [Hibiscus sabdariffa]|uniref:Uncharacterized protein n=1 Tax=Hibiscus sabdariffa TaxID=183260 RepID=A0ABR2N8J8_9ROSI
MLSQLFVFHKSKNFTSDYEIRMPPTVPVNHYSDPEGQHNRIRILAGGTTRPIKARSASLAVGTSRPVLTVRRTGRPTPRINQVAFLRDVRPACSSTHYLGRGEAITGQDHRSCRGTKCTSYERPGPRPYAHEIFRIQKHDRASMHRRGRIMPIDTLGTSSTTEVHQAATRSLDEEG